MSVKRSKDPEVGQDILRRYLVGGVWKRHLLEKLGRGNRTKSTRSRTYIAIPPPEGWSGGDPFKNGLRARRG